MSKVAISTQYTNSCNYGGVLQSYALCIMVNDFGNVAEQIMYIYQRDNSKTRLKRMLKEKRLVYTVKAKILSYVRRIINRLSNVSLENNKRTNSFKDFRDSIPHTSVIYNDESLSTCTQYDIYITGSDQVWNIGASHHFSTFYWLSFVEKDKPKISYAASMSTNDVPESLYPRIRELLSDYKAISVREKQDKELLDKILGPGRVQWVLDPTLLLTREEWNGLCEDNPFKGKHYVFVYILGDSKKQRRFVTEWAKKNNKIIINIPYLLGQYRSCDRKFGDIRKSDVTPNLWLSLIRDADCVFTDSFHACVFSSIFHTPFYVFKRCKDTEKTSMNSRIYSLTDLLDCRDRIIDEHGSVDSIPSLNGINFDHADERVAEQRKLSLDFLINALEG